MIAEKKDPVTIAGVEVGWVEGIKLGADGMEQRFLEFHKLQRLVLAITDTTQIDATGRERLVVSRHPA